MAHWWAYRIGRPPSSVCRLSSTRFKHLLRNHWADWSQISYGVSMGWRNESLFKQSWSHDKMAAMPIHVYGKNLKKSSSPEPKGRCPWNLYAALGARVLSSLFKWWPWVDLDLFYGKVKFGTLCFCMAKSSDPVWPGHVTNGKCQNMLSWLDFSTILKHYGH